MSDKTRSKFFFQVIGVIMAFLLSIIYIIGAFVNPASDPIWYQFLILFIGAVGLIGSMSIMKDFIDKKREKAV